MAIKIARLNFLGTPPSSRYDSGEIDFLPEIAGMSAKRNLLLGILALQNGEPLDPEVARRVRERFRLGNPGQPCP